MEHKQLFNVLITDEDGKELVNCKSDCIVGAVSNIERDTEGRHAIITMRMTYCPNHKIINAFRLITELKDKICREDKDLKKAFVADALMQLQDIIDREIEEGEGDA